MANTIDTSLISSIASAKAISTLGSMLAPFKAFTTDFSDQVVKAQGIVNVPLASSAAAVNTNPTSFTAGNSTLGNIPVTLNHYSLPFGLTSKELNQGVALETLVEKSVKAFAQKLWQVVITPLKTANGYSTDTVPAGATFAAADMADVWGMVSSFDKAVILDVAHYSKLIPTSTTGLSLADGAYGFSNGVYCTNDLSTAQASAVGFVASKEALAMATGIPETFGNEFIDQTLITLEDIGITIQQNLYYNGNRGLNMSYDVALGVGAGDTSAAMILLNA